MNIVPKVINNQKTFQDTFGTFSLKTRFRDLFPKNNSLKFTSRLYFSLIAVLFSSLACRAVADLINQAGQPPPAPPPATLQAAPDTPQPPSEPALVCPEVTGKILAAATEFYEADSGEDFSREPQEYYLATYSVLGEEILDPYFEDAPSEWLAYQEDEAAHQEIWAYFAGLVPPEERPNLVEFSIVTDGRDNLLAAVAQTYDDPERWALEVDILDADDKLNLTYTLIHEYAHLLTLGPSQVSPSLAIFENPDDEDIYLREASACPQYFPGEGCAYPESYLNAFFDRFWTGIHAEWQDINLIEDDEAYYQALDGFYSMYRDQFVTAYAATNPEEDIAETFTFFILSPRPAGHTLAEQKILFFYEYPELVDLRARLLTSLCALHP